MPRHPRVSPTTDSLSARVFEQLAERVAEHEGPLFKLSVGDTYLEPPPAARAQAQRTEDHPRLHNYAPVQGEPVFLDAIVERLRERSGLEIPRSRVQVMSGATAGLSVVAKTLLDPGDEVLLPAPFWPLVRGIVAGRGAVPVQIPLFDRLADPSFDAEAALEAAVTDRTVALYVNTPHNPTGRVLPDDVVAAMARVARRHDLWVLCDEAYEELWLGEAPTAPVWAREDLRDRAVACHTLSKSYGLAGSRVGWTHGPEEVTSALRAVQTFTTYCAPRPLQIGAARALREGGPFLDECRRRYRQAGWAAADALGIDPPQGGTFLFFDASPLLPPDADSCLPLLERCLDAGVLLTPGGACGEAYQRWVRLCFTSVPPDQLRDALARLRPLLAG